MNSDSQTISKFSLERTINHVLLEKFQSDDRDYSYFHPSELSQCARKLVYKYYQSQGICKVSDPVLIDPRLQRIFDNGHHVHYRLAENLENTGILKGVWQCQKCKQKHGESFRLGVKKPATCDCGHSHFSYGEISFYDPETLLGGQVDCILDLRGYTINDHRVEEDASDLESSLIVDFKSMRTEAFRNLEGPKIEHISQMHAYFYLSGLKFGKFLYENKNDQSFKEYLVIRDENIVAEIVKIAKTLKQIVLGTNSNGKRVLPPRAHKRKNTRECMECAFRSHCWKLK